MTDEKADWAADNPFASPSPLPYQAPPFDRIREEHFLPAFKAGMAQHLDEVRAIRDGDAPATFENTIEAMERVGLVLERTSRVFFNLTGSTTTDALQAIQAEVAPKLAAHQDAILLDDALFARVQQVYDARDALPPEERRLTERYHLKFVRHGALLDAPRQRRVREINERCSMLTTRFEECLLKETQALAVVVDDRAALAGLSDGDVSAAADAAAAAGHEGKYLLTIELPTSQGILSSLDDRDTRRRVFEAAVARCDRDNEHDTKAIARELAALRAEHAALLGYETHGHYVLADETAGTPGAVRAMLDSMTGAVVAKVAAEADDLQQHLDLHLPGAALEPWDWAWTAEQLRRARYDLDEGEVKQFFEFERVLVDGVFFMAEQLYGVTMRERDDIPVYHEDVRVFEMFEESGETVGLFYADYY
ncbi:MAG: M3 family metallopeptidase, partial [Planctomycetota bacterium]|nr:M3 family metallopeptidase [Planctomycetota bacterium]